MKSFLDASECHSKKNHFQFWRTDMLHSGMCMPPTVLMEDCIDNSIQHMCAKYFRASADGVVACPCDSDFAHSQS